MSDEQLVRCTHLGLVDDQQMQCRLLDGHFPGTEHEYVLTLAAPDRFFGVAIEEAVYKLFGQMATALGVVEGQIDGIVIDGPEELVNLAVTVRRQRDQALRSMTQQKSGVGPYIENLIIQFLSQYGDTNVPRNFLQIVAGVEIEEQQTQVKYLTERELLCYMFAMAMKNNEHLIEAVKRAELTLAMQGKTKGGLVIPTNNREVRRHGNNHGMN